MPVAEAKWERHSWDGFFPGDKWSLPGPWWGYRSQSFWPWHCLHLWHGIPTLQVCFWVLRSNFFFLPNPGPFSSYNWITHILLTSRGGVMYWADSIGAKYIHGKLEEWTNRYGGFFKPCSYLADRAAKGIPLVSKSLSFQLPSVLQLFVVITVFRCALRKTNLALTLKSCIWVQCHAGILFNYCRRFCTNICSSLAWFTMYKCDSIKLNTLIFLFCL